MFELKMTGETEGFAHKIAVALKAAYEANLSVNTLAGRNEAQVYLGLSELFEEGKLLVLAVHEDAPHVVAMTHQEFAHIEGLIERGGEMRVKAYAGDVLLAWLAGPGAPRLPQSVADALLGGEVEVRGSEDVTLADDEEIQF